MRLTTASKQLSLFEIYWTFLSPYSPFLTTDLFRYFGLFPTGRFVARRRYSQLPINTNGAQ